MNLTTLSVTIICVNDPLVIPLLNDLAAASAVALEEYVRYTTEVLTPPAPTIFPYTVFTGAEAPSPPTKPASPPIPALIPTCFPYKLN